MTEFSRLDEPFNGLLDIIQMGNKGIAAPSERIWIVANDDQMADACVVGRAHVELVVAHIDEMLGGTIDASRGFGKRFARWLIHPVVPGDNRIKGQLVAIKDQVGVAAPVVRDERPFEAEVGQALKQRGNAVSQAPVVGRLVLDAHQEALEFRSLTVFQ